MECDFLRQACDIPSPPQSLGHVTISYFLHMLRSTIVEKVQPASGKHHL